METVLLCIGRFLRITDELWIKRAEAVLGTPTPFIYDKNILSSLDEEKYVFPSTLENIFPLESLLNYAHINRLRYLVFYSGFLLLFLTFSKQF